MKFKPGDRVRWIDPEWNKNLGRTAVIQRWKEDTETYLVTWEDDRSLGGGWAEHRFELAPQLTPFEAEVQVYINAELQR